MKRPSEMTNAEFGEKLGDIYLNTSDYETAGLALRAFLAEGDKQPPPSLADLRAEVSRTTAVLRALLTSDVAGTRRAMDEETRRLIDLRAQQAKLDPVLGEAGK